MLRVVVAEGPRVQTAEYAWTREFEHATEVLDLTHPSASKVTFY